MSRIQARFELLRERGECALIPFISAGDPDLATTAELVLAMGEAGADAIEIGVPFSDPIAEGPTIQRSSERGIASNATLHRILEMVETLRKQVEVPLILMGYANPIYAMGSEAFADAARRVGVDGIIVADLPPEEGLDLFSACRKNDVDPILLAAPTTTPERLRQLVDETRGFLYYVSLTGVTGARESLAVDIEASVREARAIGKVPVCVGFGISTPEHAARVAAYADGVIVGSAIVSVIESASSPSDAVQTVASFIRELKAPLRSPAR